MSQGLKDHLWLQLGEIFSRVMTLSWAFESPYGDTGAYPELSSPLGSPRKLQTCLCIPLAKTPKWQGSAQRSPHFP